MALLKNTHPFHLSIAGDGEERGMLETLTQELGLAENVEFLGSRPRDFIAQELLSRTDIFVNPSLQEGLPTTVIEGLMASCVVVATDVGGTIEISKHDDLIIAEPGNVENLSQKIAFAIEHHHHLHGLSKSSVSAKFDAHESMRRFVTIYKFLLNRS